MNSEKLKDIRILIVEDNDDHRYLLGHLLERAGAIVEKASHVDEALLAVEDFVPDVVVSDIKLPGKNGIDLIRILKSQNPTVHAVAISASADTKTREECLREGFDLFIGKPLEFEDLLEQLTLMMATSLEDYEQLH